MVEEKSIIEIHSWMQERMTLLTEYIFLFFHFSYFSVAADRKIGP